MRLLAPEAPPQLVDVTGVDPVDELREGAVRFGQALTDSVQDRVRATGGAVGADLSGGPDSSAAVALAADAGTVHAVTYADGYTSGEDMAFASRIAEHTGARHTVATGGDEQLPFGFPDRRGGKQREQAEDDKVLRLVGGHLGTLACHR
ncbi:asparagine synthase-related protein [Streptomyces sp. NPDC002889]|uniref:asparagine synthase-related protein n=1 Tax=Streptomyces sp. NPDC002889 TaxID=3364669 RepID=UPI0036A369A6